MLDTINTAQVISELLKIDKAYGKERFIITRDENKVYNIKRLSTFIGKYSMDDLSIPDKVNELIGRGKNVLIIGGDKAYDFKMELYYY